MSSNPVLELLGGELRKPNGDLVQTSEACANKVIALYFSAHWCPPCKRFTPVLSEKYTALKEAKGDDFEMVFVSSDRDVGAFEEYHKEMTFLALPYIRRDEKAKLSKMFKVSGIPSLVFVDADGILITDNGRDAVSSDSFIEDFPYTPKPLLELLGDELRSPEGKTVKTSEAVTNKRYLALYFSAHWCPPCKRFTPQFAEKYKALKAADKDFECVFVSSDRDEEAFDEYHGEMPWLALPYSMRNEKSALSQMFGVSGIPSLVFYDLEAKKLITDDCQGDVLGESFLEDFPYHAKPCYDLSASTSGINDEVSLVVVMEGASEEVQKATKEALMELATEEKAKPESEQAATKFFSGCGGGPLGRVRSMCGLPAVLVKHAHALEVKDSTEGAWYCDGCSGKGSDRKERHRCPEGCDFDLCENCAKKSEEKSEPQAPVLLLLDLDDEGAYYVSAEGSDTTSKVGMKSFLALFAEKKLERQQIKG